MKTCPACNGRYSLPSPNQDTCFNCWATYRSAPPPPPSVKKPAKRKFYVN